jgi:hypothetical protein
MTLARAIIGTLSGIPQAMGEADLDDLHAVERALQDTRNAVLDIALRRLARAEGDRLAAAYGRRALSSSKQKGPTA